MKKPALPVQSAPKKRVLVKELAYNVSTGQWVPPSAKNAYRYSFLDREQRRAEGLALRASILNEGPWCQ